MYQVETVGDKYMAVSGLPEPCTDHARCIARLSLDMMDISNHLKDPYGNQIVVRLNTEYSLFSAPFTNTLMTMIGRNIVLNLITSGMLLICGLMIVCFIRQLQASVK
jgi:hypothetical protein